MQVQVQALPEACPTKRRTAPWASRWGAPTPAPSSPVAGGPWFGSHCTPPPCTRLTPCMDRKRNSSGTTEAGPPLPTVKHNVLTDCSTRYGLGCRNPLQLLTVISSRCQSTSSKLEGPLLLFCVPCNGVNALWSIQRRLAVRAGHAAADGRRVGAGEPEALARQAGREAALELHGTGPDGAALHLQGSACTEAGERRGREGRVRE